MRNGSNNSSAGRSPAAQRKSFSAIAPPSCGTSAARGASFPPRSEAGTLSARCAATTVTSACGTTSHERRTSPTSGRSGSAAARGEPGVSQKSVLPTGTAGRTARTRPFGTTWYAPIRTASATNSRGTYGAGKDAGFPWPSGTWNFDESTIPSTHAPS